MLIESLLTAAMLVTALPPAAPAALLPHAGEGVTLATAQDKSERMTVGVFVNGKGPYAFAVDTGSERTVIARSVSDSLALPSGKSAKMHSMSGVSRIDTAMITQLRIGANEVRDVRAPVIADNNLGAAGLLGIDGLAGQRVEMDFIAGSMTITPSRVAEDYEPGTIVVRARRKFGQLILVDADVDGESVHVILDSGAQISIGNEALRRKLRRRGNMDRPRKIVLVDVVGRDVPAEMSVLNEMRIGGLEVHGMAIAWSDAHPFRLLGLKNKPALLLGMDLLRAFERVSVDFGNKKVRFLRRDGG